MKLEGTVAIVIGGARGIGKAYCVSLLERRAKVVCTDILDDIGKETETELQQKYGSDHVIYRRCDGRNDEQITETLNFAKSHFGRLDIVVNNVGFVHEKQWQPVLDINIGVTIRVTNAVLEVLGKDKGGTGGILVHTASNAGLMPAFFGPIYSATKAAVIAYTRAWTHKINYETHGVRMFTICPSITDTDFFRQNLDPNKFVKFDVVSKMVNFNDSSKLLKPEWVGEALIKGLEDDNANGVAIQLVSKEPVYFFEGPNNEVAAAAVKR